jgi:protein TonB
MKNKILLFSITFLVVYQVQSFVHFTKNENYKLNTSYKIHQIGEVKPILTETQNKLQDTLVYSDASLTVKPEFPGGLETFNAHVNIFLKKSNNKKDTVFITFIVERNGELSNIKILKGVDSHTDKQIDKEIIEIVKNSPKWKPGELSGKKVRSMIPLFLTLDGKY